MAHSLCAALNPLARILLVDAAADLHAALPCRKGFLGCGIVSGAQHYDVGAFEVVLLVQVGIVCGGVLRGPVRLELVGRRGAEGATDNLLDAAGVEIYARAELCHCVLLLLVLFVFWGFWCCGRGGAWRGPRRGSPTWLGKGGGWIASVLV
jgi:hypothetical protein